MNEITQPQPQTGCFSHQIEILFVIEIAKKKNRKKEKQTKTKHSKIPDMTIDNPSTHTYTRDPNTINNQFPNV